MPEKKTAGPYAKKSFGQNFLVNPNYIQKIIDALDPQKDETIVEIGPGRGALTEKLIARAGRVIAVELDKDLIPLLEGRFKEQINFRLVESDALKVDFRQLTANSEQPTGRIKLVANLPYYISTAILQKLIEQRAVFGEMVLMFQREVVERITAPPGSTERGFLTVLVEAYLAAEKLFDVPPNAFRPAPKVWSAVVRLITKDEEQRLAEDEDLFKKIVSAGFAQKRKTIANNLKSAPPALRALVEGKGGAQQILSLSEIEPNRRAESLTLAEWARLLNVLA